MASTYVQARAGIERAGRSRANLFTQNVVVTIAGVNCTASTLIASLKVVHALNSQPDTATFTLKSSAPITPVRGNLVTISIGSASNVDFGGQIQRVTRRYVMASGAPILYYDIECVDFTRLLDRRIAIAHYGGQSATDIALSLIATFTSGFTTNSVAPGLPTIDDFPITNETLSSALRRLANLIDGNYFLDGYRDLHFFGIAGDQSRTAGTAPKPLTVSLWSLLSFAYTEDGSQIRTRDIIDGKSTTCPLGTPSGETSITIDASASVDWLLGGGGAGGGASTGNGNGGGGAGQVKTGTDTIKSGSYPVVIGAGGAAATNGSDSSWNGHTATGGGKGASGPGNGTAGGNGGGAGSSDASGGTGGVGTDNNGGGAVPGDVGIGVAGSGGGGGGATGAGGGGSFPGNGSGSGGPGLTSSIDGTARVYGSGGGGGCPGGQTAGAGGTGAGSGGAGAAGGDATGYCSGGGGAGDNATGGAGFHGRLVLSYAVGALSATGGTITTSGGRTIHTFDANDTFVVSDVTYTAPAPLVTDIPLADASQIDPNPGVVRIGTQVFPYLSTGGPVVATGANPPGSTLSADAAATDTELHVVDDTQFTAAPGWVQAGSQIVRFSGISAGLLTGIPAIGFGGLTAAVASGTQVTWLGQLNLSVAGVTFDTPISAGDSVTQRVIVDDTIAQSTEAAIEGGDGIHEYYVQDGRLSVAGATTHGTADVADFKGSIISAVWQTRDLNARAGRMQDIDFEGLTTSLIITRSEITFPVNRDGSPGLPKRTCNAESVHAAALLDAIVTS